MALTEFEKFDRRLELVDFALSWVGQSAPKAMWPRMLGIRPPVWRPGKKRIHWCAIFCSWCIVYMGLADWRRFRLNVGFSQFGLPTTKHPLPGDVAVFEQNWHHAFVDTDDEPTDGLVPLINGNSGPAPGKVAVSRRPIGDAFCYYSIEPLLETPFVDAPTKPGLGPRRIP